MKIANRHLILLSWLIGLVIGPAIVWAESPNPPAMPATTMPTATPSAATAAVEPKTPPIAMPKAASASDSITPEIKIPDLPKPLDGEKKDSLDSKIPDSVKETVKSLSTKAGDVTLDDLNAAREAIAKLDALIDIEKRLADLAKIRNEREKESERKLAEAIPRSALIPPASYASPSAEKPAEAKLQRPVPTELEVVRIEGSNGHYSAVVKDEGVDRMVHAGDHLSDGSVVLSVTTQGVETERDKTTHMAQIKDVRTVFGDSP